MTFWSSSTKEQRIAQIMGGIECGMSSRHIGTNCRTTQKAVLEFCRRNGIKIPVPKRVKRAAVAAPKPKPVPKPRARKQIRRPDTPAYTPTASHRDAWTIFAPSLDDRFLETFEDVDA